MALNMYPMGNKRCYACIQWNGSRVLDHEKKLFRVDLGSEGKCLITQRKVKGNFTCPEFFPVK